MTYAELDLMRVEAATLIARYERFYPASHPRQQAASFETRAEIEKRARMRFNASEDEIREIIALGAETARKWAEIGLKRKILNNRQWLAWFHALN